MQDSNIAWTSDRTQLYGNYIPSFFNQIPSLRGGATINGTVRDDQHFLVWMRPGAARTVRKLYAQINEDIPAGDCCYQPGILRKHWPYLQHLQSLLLSWLHLDAIRFCICILWWWFCHSCAEYVYHICNHSVTVVLRLLHGRASLKLVQIAVLPQQSCFHQCLH